MSKKFRLLAVVGLVALAWVGSASAYTELGEFCFGLDNAGNKFKLQVNQTGPFFQLTGSERVFADRAITGTAFPGANTVRVGFLHIGNAGSSVTDIIWNVSLSGTPPNLSGPYTARRVSFGDDINGTMSQISCAGLLGSEGLPDLAAQ